MKFSQLPLGGRFLHQGKTYLKTSPLLAQAEGGEQPRLIARSTEIEALGPQGTERPPAPPLPRPRVDQAMHGLAGRINACIAGSDLPGDTANRLLRQLQEALDECRQILDLP